ncbi:MAG TPA: hypothetical protein VGP26_24460 [Actinophytocola sp.]|jgi:hypothetical protein|nr:hypothetical protein [Actinophytocola sp.]
MTRAPGNSESAQLAGEMHATEWALADHAYDVSDDTEAPAELLELAERLELLARVLRARALRAVGTARAVAEGNTDDEKD